MFLVDLDGQYLRFEILFTLSLCDTEDKAKIFARAFIGPSALRPGLGLGAVSLISDDVFAAVVQCNRSGGRVFNRIYSSYNRQPINKSEKRLHPL